MKIKKGDRIQLEYTGKLDDGTTFEKTEDQKPLEFTVGEGEIIPGIEKAVEGMDIGESKTVAVKPNEAFGPRDTSLISRVDKSALAGNFVPQKGMMVTLHLQTGDVVPATIIDVTDNDIVVDLNHPLAGKDLSFDIKVVSVEPRMVSV